MTTVAAGIGSQIIALAETTWGVAPSLTSGARTYEFKTEGLELKKTTVQGQGLHAGGLYDRTRRRVVTNYDAGGPITMDIPSRNLGILLQAMVGSYGVTLAAPTQISTTGVYQSYHTPGTSMNGHSICIQKGVPDTSGVADPFTYVGCKIADWEITVETGAIAQLALTIDARNELAGSSTNNDSLNATVPALGGYNEALVETATGWLDVFHFRQATLYTGGTPTLTSGITTLASEATAGNVKSCNIKQALSLDSSRYFLGSAGFKAEQLENGFRSITGGFTVEWLTSEAMYNAFSADTTTSLELSFVGSVIGSSGTNTELLDIIIPNIRLDGESPKVGGPEVVTQAVTFTGLDDETTTPIQIHYQSADSAV